VAATGWVMSPRGVKRCPYHFGLQEDGRTSLAAPIFTTFPLPSFLVLGVEQGWRYEEGLASRPGEVGQATSTHLSQVPTLGASGMGRSWSLSLSFLGHLRKDCGEHYLKNQNRS
jgi:hypothetical protein